MNIRIELQTIFIVCFILVSCNRGDSRSEVHSNYLLKEYYHDSTLQYEVPLKNGKMHGVLKSYYPNGNLQFEQSYEEGLKSGYSIHYYENGNIKEEVYFVNSKPFGHAYYFFQNGVLDTYSSFDFTGKAHYVRKYDEKGNITYDQGTALGQLYEANEDSLILLFSYAKPPKTNSLVRVQIETENNLVIRSIPLDKRIGEIFLDKDFNGRMVIIAELIDSVTNKIIRIDSLMYPNN